MFVVVVVVVVVVVACDIVFPQSSFAHLISQVHIMFDYEMKRDDDDDRLAHVLLSWFDGLL